MDLFLKSKLPAVWQVRHLYLARVAKICHVHSLKELAAQEKLLQYQVWSLFSLFLTEVDAENGKEYAFL
jgi:hypothetical protein